MKYSFYYCHNELLRNGFSRYGAFFSQQFCEFFAEKFEYCFTKETGIKPSAKVTIAGYKQANDLPFYQSAVVSKFNLVLWLMPEYNDNISFCWRSKSGKIIKPTDENFDEADLECWIEGLKPAEYWKQVATEKKNHPFQISNLPFSLKVFGFGVDTELRIITVNQALVYKMGEIIGKIINNYNDKSEAINRRNGVVHNFNIETEPGLATARIDTGSAGIAIIKQILR